MSERDPIRDPIHDYVSRVGRALAHHGLVAERSLHEIEAHLRDSAASRETEGLSPREAALAAIDSFGPADAMARQLDRVLAKEYDPMQRILSIVIAFNVFTAVSGAGISLVVGKAPPHILVGTLAVGLVVLLASALTFVSWKRNAPALSLAAGVVLVSMGSAGVAWTLSQGLATGDPAYWATMFTMFYFGQGLMTCMLGWRQQSMRLRRA